VSHITLPRAVAEQVRKALEVMQSYAAAERKGLRICDEAVITITAALAEPEQPQKARPDLLERVEDTVEENDDAKRD
jgi:hypothetical protein